MKFVLLSLLVSCPLFAVERVEKRESCKTSGYCCAYVFGKGYKCQYHFLSRCDGEKVTIIEDGKVIKQTECKKK